MKMSVVVPVIGSDTVPRSSEKKPVSISRTVAPSVAAATLTVIGSARAPALARNSAEQNARAAARALMSPPFEMDSRRRRVLRNVADPLQRGERDPPLERGQRT